MTGLCWLTPLSTIFQLYRGDKFYWWRKSEDQEKTIDLSQVIDKLYDILLYTSPWSRFELIIPVVIDTDCIGSCKSNYQRITATTTPFLIYNSANTRYSKNMIQLSTKINVQNKTENRCYSHRYDSFHFKEFKYIMHDVQDESVL